MSRLIDADKLKDLMFVAYMRHEHGFISGIENVIDDCPTIDAVPVVRCKDCKYRTWFAPYYGCGNFESPFYVAVDKDVAIMTKPDDYCSYGERRDNHDAVRAIAENEV